MSAILSLELFAYAVYLVATTICGLAIWKGDRPLSLAGAVMIGAWILSALAGKRDIHGMNYPTTVIDIGSAVAFVWISLRWRRLWCAVLAALMIIEIVIPFVVFFDRDLHRYNQFVSHNIVAVLHLVVLVVAIGLTLRSRTRTDEALQT